MFVRDASSADVAGPCSARFLNRPNRSPTAPSSVVIVPLICSTTFPTNCSWRAASIVPTSTISLFNYLTYQRLQGMTAWRAELFDAKRPFADAVVVQGSQELAPSIVSA